MSIDGTDKRTDGQTIDRYVDPESTSCYSNGSDRPHRRGLTPSPPCVLLVASGPREDAKTRRVQCSTGVGYTCPQSAPSRWGMRAPNLTHSSLGSRESAWHLDRFSCFCRVHGHDQRLDGPRYILTSVAIARFQPFCLQRGRCGLTCLIRIYYDKTKLYVSKGLFTDTAQELTMN